MLYNCDSPGWRGVNLRTADLPWGPWSDPQIIFQSWTDDGYCHFMHVSWGVLNCDKAFAPGMQDLTGGEYGPYQLADFASEHYGMATIYFTMSTWNPYTVVLMKAALGLKAQ